MNTNQNLRFGPNAGAELSKPDGTSRSTIIRAAVASDFAAVDAFDPFAGSRVREIDEGRMFVAEIDCQIVGYVSWTIAGFVGRDYVNFLCVTPKSRRCGLALSLLRAVETRVASGRLFISTEEDNEAMLALLDREGWTNAGAVAGANTGNRAEVFFYKDQSAA